MEITTAPAANIALQLAAVHTSVDQEEKDKAHHAKYKDAHAALMAASRVDGVTLNMMHFINELLHLVKDDDIFAALDAPRVFHWNDADDADDATDKDSSEEDETHVQLVWHPIVAVTFRSSGNLYIVPATIDIHQFKTEETEQYQPMVRKLLLEYLERQ